MDWPFEDTAARGRTRFSMLNKVRFAIIVSCRLRELFSAYRKAGFDAIIIAVQLRSGQKTGGISAAGPL